MSVLVVGASGNLGSHIAHRLLQDGHRVRLAHHASPLPDALSGHQNAESVHMDLARPQTLKHAVVGVDTVVFSAGKLFAPNPKKFLPITNTQYVRNMADSAVAAGARRFVLLSFPHVEEGTTPQRL